MGILLLSIPYWKQEKRANTLIVSSVKWVIATKATGKSAFLFTVSFSSPSCSVGDSKREKNVHRDKILLRTCWNHAIQNWQAFIPTVPRFPYFSDLFPSQLLPPAAFYHGFRHKYIPTNQHYCNLIRKQVRWCKKSKKWPHILATSVIYSISFVRVLLRCCNVGWIMLLTWDQRLRGI